MKAIIASNLELYRDIDNCITELIRARRYRDEIKERMILSRMESLMCATLQQLQCCNDKFRELLRESDVPTVTVTRENMERLLNEAKEFRRKADRISMGEEKADAVVTGSFDEYVKEAWRKQQKKDIESEINSIHLGVRGNGLVDGMLRYKDTEDEE